MVARVLKLYNFIGKKNVEENICTEDIQGSPTWFHCKENKGERGTVRVIAAVTGKVGAEGKFRYLPSHAQPQYWIQRISQNSSRPEIKAAKIFQLKLPFLPRSQNSPTQSLFSPFPLFSVLFESWQVGKANVEGQYMPHKFSRHKGWRKFPAPSFYGRVQSVVCVCCSNKGALELEEGLPQEAADSRNPVSCSLSGLFITGFINVLWLPDDCIAEQGGGSCLQLCALLTKDQRPDLPPW